MFDWTSVEKLANIDIPDAVRRCAPLADKLIVVVEKAQGRTLGGLIEPETTVSSQTGGSGWVIARGPDAGHELARAAGLVQLDETLGLKVCFGRHAGEALVVSDRDDEYSSRFRVIQEQWVMLVLDVPNTKPNGDPQ